MKRIAKQRARTDIGPSLAQTNGLIVSTKKPITICGSTHRVDHESLIRMVRQVTQTIGEYNGQDTPYAAYIVGALRKARADMVSDLERYFGVHWRIDEATGKSIFYV